MINLIKFSPVFLLGVLVFNGTDILISASVGLIYAAVLCVILEKVKLNEIMGIAVEGAKDGMLPSFVLMLAYALAEIYMATGVGAAAIGLFINLGVTGATVATVALIASCVLSTATGTSWGTFAACIPIFMWLCDIVGGNPALTFAATVGGSAFGDNIGLISDTTILSSGFQGVKVVDRVRVQAPWSILCVIVSAILTFVTGKMMGLPNVVGDTANIISRIPQEAWEALMVERPAVITLLEQVQTGVPIYMLIPVILVIVMAIMQIDTIICLASGIVAASIFGAIAGTITSPADVASLVQTGFESAGSWAVIMLFWAMGFGAVMRRMDAFTPLARMFVKMSRKVRHLLCCNGLLCLIINGTVNEEMSQMATVGPILREIVDNNVEGSEEDKYKLRNRSALFSDGIGVMSATLIPWHTGVAYYMGLAAAVYPLYSFTVGDLYFNYLAIIMILSIFFLTFTGLDRFILWFGLPSEPDVKLIKAEDKKEEVKAE